MDVMQILLFQIQTNLSFYMLIKIIKMLLKLWSITIRRRKFLIGNKSSKNVTKMNKVNNKSTKALINKRKKGNIG